MSHPAPGTMRRGSRRTQVNRMTKKDFLDECYNRGFTVITKKHNIGEWNEHTTYSVMTRPWHVVEVVNQSKGERVNWLHAYNAVGVL